MSGSADKHDCHTEPMIEFEFRNVPGIYFSHTYNVESTFKKKCMRFKQASMLESLCIQCFQTFLFLYHW